MSLLLNESNCIFFFLHFSQKKINNLFGKNIDDKVRCHGADSGKHRFYVQHG